MEEAEDLSFMVPRSRNRTNGWKFQKSTFELYIRENVSTFGAVIRGWVFSKSGMFPIPENVQAEAG